MLAVCMDPRKGILDVSRWGAPATTQDADAELIPWKGIIIDAVAPDGAFGDIADRWGI